MITELFFNMIFSVVDIVLTVIPSFNVPVLGSLAGVIELFSLSSFLDNIETIGISKTVSNYSNFNLFLGF